MPPYGEAQIVMFPSQNASGLHFETVEPVNSEFDRNLALMLSRARPRLTFWPSINCDVRKHCVQSFIALYVKHNYGQSCARPPYELRRSLNQPTILLNSGRNLETEALGPFGSVREARNKSGPKSVSFQVARPIYILQRRCGSK